MFQKKKKKNMWALRSEVILIILSYKLIDYNALW